MNQKLENPWEIENNKKTQKPHSKLQQGAIGVTLAGLCWEVLESVTKEQAEIISYGIKLEQSGRLYLAVTGGSSEGI